MAVGADPLLDLVRDPTLLAESVGNHRPVSMQLGFVQLASPSLSVLGHRSLRLVIVTCEASADWVNRQSRHRYRGVVRVLLLLLLSSAVAGCGATTEAVGPVPRDPAIGTSPSTYSDDRTPKKTVERCRRGSVQRMGTARTSYAAVVRKRAIAFRRPGESELARFGPKNINGVATVFAVLAKRVDRHCAVSWYRVQLPLKPNGITGWVRPYAVNVLPLTTRIKVDLSARRVTLFVRGKKALSATAAIGATATPTPTGRYYVNQRLIPTDSSGPFGPGAIGISAFSEVLTGWAQGGPIAIHGTNRPQLLGQAVSNGCIRIHNDKLMRLFRRALAGTPVTVSD